MKIIVPLIVFLASAGCWSRSPNRSTTIGVQAELKTIEREEQTALGFERRLLERGATIQSGPKSGERLATIAIPTSLEYVRVVYAIEGDKVAVIRTEVIPGSALR